MMKKVIFAAAALLLPVLAGAQQSLMWLDKWDGQYELGDTVRVHSTLSGNPSGKWVKTVYVNGLQSSSESVELPDGTYDLLVAAYEEPTAVMVKMAPQSDASKAESIGFICGAEGFRPGFERPDDFKRFWKRQVREMRRIPMNARLEKVGTPAEYAGKVECWAFTLDCVGGVPCRGYIAKPVGAAKKSLPIVFYAHAAGVSKTHCRSDLGHTAMMAALGNGALAIDMNAHGMLNGQDQSYYDELAKELNGYNVRHITGHEDYYFRGMFLRMQRALDFICQDKCWDGKRVLVTGESQGGAQTAAIAGLDKRVTDIYMRVPAMLDMGGKLDGRLGAWPRALEKDPDNPKCMEVLPYYDGASFLKGCKAEVHVEIGLIDTTCPPACVFAAVNGAAGAVHVYTYPYRTHASPYRKLHPDWYDTIYKNRMEYYNKFCK